MDLNTPQEGLAEYDRKIAEIERNLQLMENQFGFNRNKGKSQAYDDLDEEQPATLNATPTPLISGTKYLNKSKDQFRYKNLTSIEVEKPKQIKNNAEISEKWPIVFSEKPNLKAFYSEEKYNPVAFDKRDFQTNINLSSNNQVFNDYMDSFALTQF